MLIKKYKISYYDNGDKHLILDAYNAEDARTQFNIIYPEVEILNISPLINEGRVLLTE